MKILYDFPTAVDLVGPVRCGKTDEERGRGLWSWCFHVPGQDRFTWFHIDPSRGSKVLKRYLGKTFRGIVGCDYFSAYRKFLRESDAWLQLCWAHLIRDVKYLTTLLDRATRNYGHRLLSRIKTLFRTWHRRGETPAIRWERAAAKARREVLAVARRAPMRSEAQNMGQWSMTRPSYFTFLDVPDVLVYQGPPECQHTFPRHRPQGHPRHAVEKLDAVGASAFLDGTRHLRPTSALGLSISSHHSFPVADFHPPNPSPPSSLYLRDRTPRVRLSHAKRLVQRGFFDIFIKGPPSWEQASGSFSSATFVSDTARSRRDDHWAKMHRKATPLRTTPG